MRWERSRRAGFDHHLIKPVNPEVPYQLLRKLKSHLRGDLLHQKDACTMGGSTGAGWSSLAARRAHNPKVVGSNPTPATNRTYSQQRGTVQAHTGYQMSRLRC